MGNILDICEKALNGPIMKEEDFDKNRFMPTALQLAKDIGIKFDKENPVPQDDAAADRHLPEGGILWFKSVGRA